MRREHFVLYAAIGVVALMLVAVLGRSGRKRGPVSGGHIQQPTTQSLAGGSALRGLAMELYHPDPRYRYERELTELAQLRSQIVCISVRGWQEDVNSSRIFIDHAAMPTEEALVAVMRRARQLGMQVLLMPIVLLRDTNAVDDWRGVIAPRYWERWWESYQRFIVHYARLAEEAGAEMFCVGSELLSTENMRQRWQETIAAVRAVYFGRVLYSANWDHYVAVSFWDDLDLIGMTAYHKMTEHDAPTLEELRRKWKEIKGEILAWQQWQGKQIVFTEAGYPSQDGCAREPWNYYGSTRVDLEEQYVCLRALFEAWSGEPAVAALCVWKWEDGGGPDDTNYTPRGKPSMELVRRWLLGGPLLGPSDEGVSDQVEGHRETLPSTFDIGPVPFDE